MNARRSVRIVKKIQMDGMWKFVPLARNGTRYVWDPRPGAYYLDWWEGRRRKEYAGETPSAALTAQRRKQHELAGALLLQEPGLPVLPQNSHAPPVIENQTEQHGGQTLLEEARDLFVAHVAAHSPDKPETRRRYRQVLEHFERHVRERRFVEAITRADIDEYKIRRCREQSQRHNRLITARTVNFEVTANFANFTDTGSAHLIAANGDSIDTTVVGSAIPGDVVFTITEIHTITGGTGRFTGEPRGALACTART
jgi:hypothetical protein